MALDELDEIEDPGMQQGFHAAQGDRGPDPIHLIDDPMAGVDGERLRAGFHQLPVKDGLPVPLADVADQAMRVAGVIDVQLDIAGIGSPIPVTERMQESAALPAQVRRDQARLPESLADPVNKPAQTITPNLAQYPGVFLSKGVLLVFEEVFVSDTPHLFPGMQKDRGIFLHHTEQTAQVIR